MEKMLVFYYCLLAAGLHGLAEAAKRALRERYHIDIKDIDD